MSGTALTPRERAVLAAVGRRLTNPEIASEMFVSVRTIESHIASLRRKLGASNRPALVAAAGLWREASVRLPPNPLRGRDGDLAVLDARLHSQSWVTVIGPGGVGKTRLALEFARSAERVPVIVELEHAEPGDVVARIARTLDLGANPGSDPLTAIGTALAAQQHLLVLDNIDRVGPAVGATITRLHAIAPDLRVLTTSRTPVGEGGESIHSLSPLATEGDDSPALEMLADRLGAQGLALETSDRGHAAAICARLDGLPLALELAASVARHLPLRELEMRLEADLTTLDRAAPEGRHRTVETAFEWTWDLLSDDERDVLRRLAALPRTFDIDLAVAVTHPGVEGVVLRLVDHSLLVPSRGDPRRFRLLAVLREFVHARTDPVVIREVHERHAVHIAEVVTVFTSTARSDDSPEALRTSETLCPEVNAALRWALAAEHPAALPLAASLAISVEQYSSGVDSVRSLAMAARDTHWLDRARPQHLLLVGSALAFTSYRFSGSIAPDVELVDALGSRALGTAVDDVERLAATHLAGIAAAYRDDGATALEHLAEAERLALGLGDEWETAGVRQMRGIALRGSALTDPDGALAAFEDAMRSYARAGDEMHVNDARYMMALTAAEHGRSPERAAQWAAECVDYAQSVGNEHELAHARLVQALLGRDEAGALEELLRTFRHLGDLRCVNRCLLIQADRAGGPVRVALLETALDVAEAAVDRDRQTTVLEALADARWRLGDRIGTLAALDRLASLTGVDRAAAHCPPELREAFAREYASIDLA